MSQHEMSAVFLGTGSALNQGLGNSACVLEKAHSPWLLIDCGHDTLSRYQEYSQGHLPAFLFITHLHFDHIAGLEQLYYQATINKIEPKPNLYVPASLVTGLTQILHNTGLAEGGINIWDALRIIPVLDRFWHDGCEFRVHPVRHHKPNTAFALHLPGVFFYSGDTKPVPEIMHHEVSQQEVIFHDASMTTNPSHSSVDEVLEQYSPSVIARMFVYHYPTREVGEAIQAKGLQIAKPGERIILKSAKSNNLPNPAELRVV